VRVFYALPLPAPVCGKLVPVAASLKRQYKGLSVAREDAFHITLFFFKEADDEEVEKLKLILDSPRLSFKAVTARFSSLGTFPQSGNPRVLFAGIGEGSGEVSAFYEKLKGLLAESNLLPEDAKRPFHPHLTLARNKFERIAPGDLKRTSLPRAPFLFDHCVLFQSLLKPTGAEYIPLKTREFNE
jgi:2'-5' RNA ligase